MIKTFLQYIYPRNIKCMICKKPILIDNTYSLCKDCFDEINFIKNGCKQCGKPLTDFYKKEKCPVCETKEYNFTKALSCVEYTDNIHKLLQNYKYKRKTYIGYHIAQIMKDKLKYEGVDFDYITYVPLSKEKLRKRGYNQAYIIAKNLSKLYDKPIIDVLGRKKDTRPLYDLEKRDRETELKDVFTINQEITKIVKKDILLVDDIFTSGATSNEIAKTLMKNEVKNIYVITFATGKNIF